ncbi:D-alanine--D-alanine ligase family protein [Kineosporia succinea]|uniref:D-alanine-D-alanine ligase n=1 Tax=Kineosporia succinea TaxID=84632 RepID=A0ABT9PBM0_9ACTN|nr:hypothetical protein [Kineosporia succinea]MDP9830073.1 D-alanine-D-alanine ligase [Kineosporia succinea]
MRTVVLHLTGSATTPFLADLSLLYARDCWTATADPTRYAMHLAHVSPDGSWRFPEDPGERALAEADPLELPQAVHRLADLRPHVVVPQMFCRPGMTTYRSLLDLLGLPYVGNPAEVMAIGTDKAHTRALLAAAGVPVPPAQLLRPGEQPTLAPPVVVKPVDSDNSAGVTLVRHEHEYPDALAGAFARAGSGRVLVESYVELGREVRCGVLERGGDLVCLPLEEYALHPHERPIRSQADKLVRTASGELVMTAKSAEHAWIVDPGDSVTGPVHEAARRAHRALGCRDYSLFDVRIDPAGRPWFLEAGLYCSFARTSVVVGMAEAAGTALPELFATMVRRARARA